MNKKALAWPLCIAAVLALTVGANVWVAFIANSDPSFSIEQDYYRKAVDWDREMEQEHQNQRLAWRLEPTLGAFTPSAGARLQLRVLDAAGKPIEGAVVRVSAFYNARADHVIEATLTREAPDLYGTTLAVDHSGQWELRFAVTRHGERFTSNARIEAVSAAEEH